MQSIRITVRTPGTLNQVQSQGIRRISVQILSFVHMATHKARNSQSRHGRWPDWCSNSGQLQGFIGTL